MPRRFCVAHSNWRRGSNMRDFILPRRSTSRRVRAKLSLEIGKISGSLLDLEETQALKASALARVGEYDAAIEAYRAIAAVNPANLEAWSSLAFLFKTIGRPDEAIEACRSALKAKPTDGEAWWMLADLKTFKFSNEEVATDRGRASDPWPFAGRSSSDALRARQGARGSEGSRRELRALSRRQPDPHRSVTT